MEWPLTCRHMELDGSRKCLEEDTITEAAKKKGKTVEQMKRSDRSADIRWHRIPTPEVQSERSK